MYFDKNTYAFWDGRWVKAADAKLSPYTQVVQYGIGVFEGMRAYRYTEGKEEKTYIFKAEEHFRRLLNITQRMNLHLPYTVEQLTQIAGELLERNKLSEAYIRPLAYAGENMKLDSTAEAHIYICAWKWGKLYGDKPLKVMTSSFCRPHPKSGYTDAKISGHYINAALATTEAQLQGFDEALLLDVNGYVAAGSRANFFYEKHNTLYTAPIGNIFPGITRSTIINICRHVGIRVEERLFRPEEVRGADSAFFAGTAAEITAIASLDGTPFRRKWENTIGVVLERHYKAMLRREEFNEVYL